MGEMRDSDWSRENLLRSDWLGLIGASITTPTYLKKNKMDCICAKRIMTD